MAISPADRADTPPAVLASPLRDRVVFALGVPRSGTHWLQRILGAHPQVSMLPTETHLFSEAVAPFLDHFHHGARDSLWLGGIYADRDALIANLRRLCDDVLRVHLEQDAQLLVERSPWHVRQVELIAEIYPDAHVLHIIRDPRDVARSMVAHEWGPDSFGEAARLWRESVLLARESGAPRYKEVRYEQLLADVPATARDIYGWLGLSASKDVLAATAAEAAVHVNRDPTGSGVGLAKWRTEMAPDAVRAVEEQAGDLLIELGYERAGGEGVPGGSGRHRAKARISSAVRRLGGRDRGTPAERHDWVTAAEAFDRVLTLLHLGRLERLGDVLTEDAVVKIIDEEGNELLRDGSGGVDALRDALADDPVFRFPQVSSNVSTTFPTTVGVLGYRVEDGALARRVLLTLARGQRVAYLTLIRV